MRAFTIVILTLVLARSAAAAPHKILVLPVDGSAEVGTRTRLTAQIARLAKALDGQIATAEATFADTALAVGCDPRAPSCSDQVMATLGVDELVWGTASRDGSQVRLVVRRATRGNPAREVSVTLAAGDAPERAEAAMLPLFSPPGAAPEPPSTAGATAPIPAASRPGPDAAPPAAAGGVPPAPPSGPASGPGPEPGPVDRGHPDDRVDRTVGIAFAAGGGVAIAIGIALWANYASLQDRIDNHAVRTRADFDDLTALEDRANRYAIAGDVLVLAGIAAAGVGGYFLYRDHRQHRVAVAPAPIGHGAGLTLTILGGL
ncbi:MAG TPA: hypothetical protein VFT22_06940 [Kofleriaceae bacterium]|nr:hypothetical protein [Kofleriaceae bacterium]